MRLSTKIGIGVFTTGLVAIGVDAVLKDQADGTLVFFAPTHTIARLVVDGQSIEIEPGEVGRVTVEHGAHTVEVQTPHPRRATVTIDSGRNLIAVPLGPEQCFVELNVTLSHYGDGAGTSPPRVSDRVRHQDPFHVPQTYALTEDELPDHTTERVNSRGDIVGINLVHLFRPVPCDVMEQDDAVLAVLGYVQ